jgi:alkyldihydroxyacetonephosphate synthase
VTPLPELESFHAVIFPTFMAGISAVRAAIDEGSSLSMLRLSDADETASLFHLPKFAERGLEWFGYPEGRCILLFGAAGSRSSVIYAIARAYALCRAHGGLPTGSFIGDVWHKNRFKGPYLRNALWDAGYAADTLETAAPWASVPRLAAELKRVLNAALEARDERVTSFAHLSHVYCDGASVYVTYLFRRTTDPDELIERWRMLKDAASRTIVNNGGTISHQHGVGTDHLPYLEPEKSPVGIAMLQNLFSSVDPEGLLNPGKLVPSRRG